MLCSKQICEWHKNLPVKDLRGRSWKSLLWMDPLIKETVEWTAITDWPWRSVQCNELFNNNFARGKIGILYISDNPRVLSYLSSTFFIENEMWIVAVVIC